MKYFLKFSIKKNSAKYQNYKLIVLLNMEFNFRRVQKRILKESVFVRF